MGVVVLIFTIFSTGSSIWQTWEVHEANVIARKNQAKQEIIIDKKDITQRADVAQ